LLKHPGSTAESSNSAALTLWALESLLLVLVGVVAAKFDSWHLIVAVLVIVALFLLIRWILAGPADREAALRQVEAVYANRSVLYADLQAIIRHCIKRERAHGWSPANFRSAAEWWFDEDLMSEYWMEREHAAHGRKAAGRFPVRRSLRRRVTGRLRRAIWSLRRLALRQPDDLEALLMAGAPTVARIVLQRSLEEGFVQERVHRHDGMGASIVYTVVDDPSRERNADPASRPIVCEGIA
jgi:hypothetical protein